MKKEDVIEALSKLGNFMVQLANQDDKNLIEGTLKLKYDVIQEVISAQVQYNGWYTEKYVRQSMHRLGGMMTESKLADWSRNYSFHDNPKKIALIMAGNIPLVNFHDLLSVLITGHHAICKLSSDDKTLLPVLCDCLIEINASFDSRISFTNDRLPQFDAVIATGSDNSKLYFEQYFGKYPHIFRSNRTSLAVLRGNETDEELSKLGNDMFDYFGRGCRNVTHLLLPKGFDLNRIFKAIVPLADLISNNKYANNYDYNKAVYLLNKVEFLDNNFVLFRESMDLFSPIGTSRYHYYSEESEITYFISKHKSQLQVIVGNKNVPFGQAQTPELSDYPDEIDTLQFLSDI